MQAYGYIRVSTKEQKSDRQLHALTEAGIIEKNIFTDKVSGKDFERSQYKRLLERLESGDRLIVKSIDRLGRNYKEIMEQWQIITKDLQADIIVLDMPLLDTTRQRDLLGTFISDVVLQILSFVAQNERDTIRQRQSEGIAAAKARGVHFGRPAKKTPANFAKLVKQWEGGSLSTKELIEQTRMKESTLYRRLRERRLSREK